MLINFILATAAETALSLLMIYGFFHEQAVIYWERRSLHRLKIFISRQLLKSKRIYQWSHTQTIKARPRAIIGDYLCWEHIPDDPNWVPKYNKNDFNGEGKQ